MRRPAWIVPIGLCLATALPAQTAYQPASPSAIPADSAGIAGWYEVGPGHKVLIVWGPTGGYRFLDFDLAHFHRLALQDHDSYTLAGGGSWRGARVVFERGRKGRATGFTFIREGGRPQSVRRAEQYPFDMEEVRFRNGEVELAGLLMVPRVKKLVGRAGTRLREVPLPLPGAVIIHGSGDSDRDNVWAFTFAQSVARAGIVTLLPDKRGSGASRGDWHTASLQDLAEDALAGAGVLRADPRVDSSRVGLIGLSQGGVVAPLAASFSSEIDWLVSISAAPMPLFGQMRFETTQDLMRAGVPPSGIASILTVMDRGATYARTMTDLDWNRYSEGLGALRSGPLARAAGGFPASRDDWRWAWWQKVGDVDPLPAWQSVTLPSFAVFGEEDEHDNVPVRESVQRLQSALHQERNVTNLIRVYPGLGHTLADSARGWVSLQVLGDLNTWILKTVGGLDPSQASLDESGAPVPTNESTAAGHSRRR